MEKHINSYLQSHSNAGEYSIGSHILLTPDPGKNIQALRHATVNLHESEHEDDQYAITSINANFGRNDYDLANYNLYQSLDTPLYRDKNVVEWMAEASDRDIEQFCIWSLKRTRDLTRSLNDDKPKLIHHTMEKTHKLTDIGLFPPAAIPVMESVTDRYELGGMDSFHSGGMGSIGVCYDQHILLANLYKNRRHMLFLTAEMKSTMFHEYIHGGGRDRGFFWGIKTGLPVLSIIEEAFVEHSNVVAHTPIVKQPNVVDPKMRSKLFSKSGVYHPERTFLAKVIDHTEIALEQLGEAYFLPRGDRRGEMLRDDIEQKIGKFFGSRQAFFDFVKCFEDETMGNRPQLIYKKIIDLTHPMTD